VELKAQNPWTWQDKYDFSHAVEVSGASRLVFCAGQTSADDEGKPRPGEDLLTQLHGALDNLETVLAQAGLRLGDVVRLNYYTTDVDAFLEAVPKVGVRLKEAGCKPSSTLLGVTRLADPEWLIEIEATAVG
jgi:enamine deaminase RidA (YjgF/YER057c/UK114 family)